MKRWKIKTSTLNHEMDYRKLWRFVKQLNDKDNNRVATTLKEIMTW